MRRQRVLAGALLLAMVGCRPGGDDELRNGYVRIQVLSEAVATEVPPSATTTVVVTLRYNECLSQFYAANPAMRQDGTIGAGDFADGDADGEGWMDRLCDGSIDGTLDCEVVAITQQLGSTEQLTVTYAVDGVVDNAMLAFGPLPTAATADCAAGELPTVQVGSQQSIRGLDGNGDPIWEAYTFDPTKVATGPSAVIRIHPGPAG